MSETERSMLDRLNRRYAKFNQNGVRYVRAEHVKITAGWEARRICDYLMMDLWTGYGMDRGPYLHGHEVKISRADWLTELKDPDKSESFAKYCDYFWLVAADKSIVKDGELPAGWGLMVPWRDTLKIVVQPTRRSPVEPMPRSLQGTLMRSVFKTTLRLVDSDDSASKYMARERCT